MNRVLDQALFRDALLRQARRADRFEEPFVLVRISLTGHVPLEARWGRILETFRLTARDTDIIGWFEDGASIGLLRAHLGNDAHGTAAGLGLAAQQELATSLEPDTGISCSIQVDVFAPHGPRTSALELAPSESDGGQDGALRRGGKRLLDIAGSLAFLFVLSPVFLVLSAAVKATSKGPVFFRQERIGQHGVPFTMLKFRTMQVNNDPTIHQQYVAQFIQAQAAAANNSGDAPVYKILNDPRITSIGHFLRRTSLDELPQFWNVLRGDMSLVGPRPPLAYEVERYKRWHWRRVLDAKPGITGLWQVTGRSRTTFDEMVRLDIRYARSHSVWTDIKILLATPRAVLTGKGAH